MKSSSKNHWMKMALLVATVAMYCGSAVAQSAASGVPRMVSWQDPSEQAFTVQVPQGWQIGGGIHRNSPMDARAYVYAVSSDGKVRVWVNDPNVLPRQEPNAMYHSIGWYEGRTVRAPGGPLLIERFRSGTQFAQEFTAQKICKNLQTLSGFDLPREAQQMTVAIAPSAAQVGARIQASAGEIVYHCGEQSGYTMAVTLLAYGGPQSPRIWTIEKLDGYLSDKSDVDIARYVLNSMIASFRMDPNWEMQYQRQVRDTTGALMAISNQVTQQSIQLAQQSLQQNIRQVQQRQQQFDQMTNMRASSFKNQMDSQDRMRQRWSDITLGQIHGCDDNGNCSTQSNEYQNHWVAPNGSVVPGPSDGSSPGPGYHEWHSDYKY